ncbi:unnamed protein product [Fusarium graminearum]|nr:unnamed protein product [Fusarium graminearum]
MSNPGVLSDELLIMILEHAMNRETPLWIDECLQLLRFNYYAAGHSRPDVFADQDVHREDWLRINSTCRRFRRLGKEIFFRTKPSLMSLEMSEKFLTGESWLDVEPPTKEQTLNLYKRKESEIAATDNQHLVFDYRYELDMWCALSAEDRDLAVSNIRHIVFSDVAACQKLHLAIIKIPKLTSTFDALQRCDIVVREENTRDEPGEAVKDYQLYLKGQQDDDNQEPDGDLRHTVAKLEAKLKIIGMNDIKLRLCPGQGGHEQCERLRLEREVFPLLRFIVETRSRKK